jgi:hypothetical protein
MFRRVPLACQAAIMRRRSKINDLMSGASKILRKKPTVFFAEFADEAAAEEAAKKVSEAFGKPVTRTQKDGVEIWTVRK